MMDRRAALAVIGIVAAWPCAACGIYCRHLAVMARDAEREASAQRSAAADAYRRIEDDRERIAAVDARIKRLHAEQDAGLRVMASEAELEPQILELREKINAAEAERARGAAARSSLGGEAVALRGAGAALSVESCRDAEEELLHLAAEAKLLRRERAGRETPGPEVVDAARGEALLDVVGDALAVVDLPRHVRRDGASSEGLLELEEAYAAAQAGVAWEARLAGPPDRAEAALRALALRVDDAADGRSGVAAADDRSRAVLRPFSALVRAGAAIAAGVRDDAMSQGASTVGPRLLDDPSRDLPHALMELREAMEERGAPRDAARRAALQRLAARAVWARSPAWSFEAQRDERERKLLEVRGAVGAIVEGCEAAHPVLETVPQTPERFSSPPPIAF